MLPEKSAIKKAPQAKRKVYNNFDNPLIYAFNNFDDYLEFCKYINKFLMKNTYQILDSSLYLYKSNYYLCIYMPNLDSKNLKSLHYSLVEFAKLINYSDLFERKLKEYGKVIFKSNAINDCIKFFK